MHNPQYTMKPEGVYNASANPLALAIKNVKVQGHGTVKVKSLQHLREILLSATK